MAGFRGLVAAALVLAAGCSIQRIAIRGTAPVMRKGSGAINAEPDMELARLGIPANLKTVEVLLATDPGNPTLLFLLSQGYGAYALLFLEDDMDLADAAGNADAAKEIRARASALYGRAQEFGRRLIGRDLAATFEKAPLDKVREAAGNLKRSQVEGVFWYVNNWVGQINLDQTNTERIAQLPRVEILVNRLVELDPSYFNGLPCMIAGGVYAGRAPMFGGDLPRGRKYLEQGIAVSGGKFLIGKFLLARYYGVQAQDRKLFCDSLAEVLAAPADLMPEQAMMNNVAKRWAARWRARAGSLFDEGGCVDAAPATGTKEDEDNGSLD